MPLFEERCSTLVDCSSGCQSVLCVCGNVVLEQMEICSNSLDLNQKSNYLRGCFFFSFCGIWRSKVTVTVTSCPFQRSNIYISCKGQGHCGIFFRMYNLSNLFPSFPCLSIFYNTNCKRVETRIVPHLCQRRKIQTNENQIFSLSLKTKKNNTLCWNYPECLASCIVLHLWREPMSCVRAERSMSVNELVK